MNVFNKISLQNILELLYNYINIIWYKRLLTKHHQIYQVAVDSIFQLISPFFFTAFLYPIIGLNLYSYTKPFIFLGMYLCTFIWIYNYTYICINIYPIIGLNLYSYTNPFIFLGLYICIFIWICAYTCCIFVLIEMIIIVLALGSHDTMLVPSKNMVLVSRRYNLVVVWYIIQP
jgi:hypothetical protein